MSTTALPSSCAHDDGFDDYVRRMNDRFGAITEPLFSVETTSLVAIYLGAFADAGLRRYHDCARCRRFLERFGGLVTIDERGRTHSAIWVPAEASETLAPAVRALARAVERLPVARVFVSSETVYGTPVTTTPEVWTHLAVAPHPSRVHRNLAFGAAEVMAQKSEDLRTLRHALAELSPRTLTRAISLLRTDSLFRSEACLGVAEFLLALHPHRNDANRLFRAVATAPPGFCTPRSGMIGTLLEDLDAGLPTAEVKRRFAAKMHPLAYLRPKAAPSEGTIARAEVLFARLGLAPALERRFARLDELETFWSPRVPSTESGHGGLFAHLRARSDLRATSDGAATMSWAKFERVVLRDALALAVQVPETGEFCGLLTAVHADAPRLFQWANPVSPYLYVGGSLASRWQLQAGSFVPVTAAVELPRHWGVDPDRLAADRNRLFVLSGACDRELTSLCLFPETIRAELHGVRSVIEAHSRSRSVPADPRLATANGILVSNARPVTVRATLPGAELQVTIDRLE